VWQNNSQFLKYFFFISVVFVVTPCMLSSHSIILPTTALFLYLKNKGPTWCHLLFYFTSYVLNMFRTFIYPSSGACDYSVELPHWSYQCGNQQHSRKLLIMDILMSETCWAHKKWNKIASDIKLVFYCSTITMMHGLIYIIIFLIFISSIYLLFNFLLILF